MSLNCIIVDDDAMSRLAIRKLVERSDSLHLVAECPDAMQAQEVLMKEPVDLVFLDIHMPGMNGLELIQNVEQKPMFVLTSARKEYAVQAFDYGVLDFLLKPIEYPRFLKSVERATHAAGRKRFDGSGKANIFVKSEPGRLVKIKGEDILYVEALADYVIIHKTNEKYTVHSTMKSIEKKLPQDDFVRVHRSFIVRLDKITEMEENTIAISGRPIPVGRAYRQDLHSRLNFI